MPRFRDNNYFRRQSERIRNIISRDVSKYILSHFQENLNKQVDENSDRLPKKKEATIEQYRRKGYNTKDWFIRTGSSVRLKVTKLAGGIKIFPSGKDILRYVPKASDWFTLSEKTKQQIIDLIRRKLR